MNSPRSTKLWTALLLLSISTIQIYGQINTEWTIRYNSGSNPNEAKAIALDDLGYIYVTGTINYSGEGQLICTIKYNTQGTEQWIAIFHENIYCSDAASAIAIDAAGNVYVTGSSQRNGGYSDYITAKYDSSGALKWVNRYNGPAAMDDMATSIALDRNGNVFVTGKSTADDPYNSYHFATIKYNSSGVQQWVQRYGLPVPCACHQSPGGNDIKLDADGNVFVTGGEADSTLLEQFITIKYNNDGVRQWVASESVRGGHGNNISIDNSGNVSVTGTSHFSYTTMKYTNDGTRLWMDTNRALGGTAYSVATDGDKNTYVTGCGSFNSHACYVTIKYNRSGVQQWLQGYCSSFTNGRSEAYALVVDDSANIYVTGKSEGSNNNYDFTTVKYNSSGVQQWVMRYDTPERGYDEADALAVNKYGDVFVTGTSEGTDQVYDYLTIKYSNLIGIKPNSNSIPQRYTLYQNYPNPFNPVTDIQYSIPKKSMVSLVVYDVLGREVITLLNEEKPPGNYDVKFDASNISSGLYFYRIVAGDYIEVKKMIVLK
jgi:hypothetical protein